MSKRKLTDAEVEAMMRDYYAWEKYNPESETSTELARRHGVSKQTLYKEKRDYERKHGNRPPALVDPGGMEDVVRYLTEELVKARVLNEHLRERIEELDAGLRAALE